jgi:3-oxoacyl-[acyl-carrier protein] reductase
MKLSELSVIVTGGASGLGREFCVSLVTAGARVFAVDINAAGLESLVADAGAGPGQLRVQRANVAKHDEMAAAVLRAFEAFGSVNALINSAGIYRDGLMVKQFGDRALQMPLAQWQGVMDVDLTGTFIAAREVVARMMERKIAPGIIINIASVMWRGNAGQSNYCAAKAGVVALTKVWAEELAPHGIRVGAIAPGFIRTPILTGTAPEKLAHWIDRVPLRRLGEPSEVFTGVRFIVECGFFTGKCLDIDGGLSV